MKKYIILNLASFAILLLAGCGQQVTTTTPSGSTPENKATVNKSTDSTYTKYFNSITISKLKPGLPGPENTPVEATEFKAVADVLQIDFDVKQEVNGEVYYELINSANGEKAMSSENNKMKITAGVKNSIGFQIPASLTGDFKLNIYFNGESVYEVPIKISE